MPWPKGKPRPRNQAPAALPEPPTETIIMTAPQQQIAEVAPAAIEPAPAPEPIEAPKRFPVKILRGYWAKDDVRDQWPMDENGQRNNRRIPVGTIMQLPIDEARRLMAAGVAERADALPI